MAFDQLGQALQASAVEPAERRRRADHHQARLALRLDAEMTPRTPRRTPPGRHPLVTPQREIQARLQGLQQGFSVQLLQQVAHPRLLRLGALEEQVEQRQHQGLAPLRRQRRQGAVAGRAAGESEDQRRGRRRGHRREPDVMGMFEHRQVFAAVQLDGELGRQRVVAAARLEPQQQPSGQRAHVQRQVRIEPGGRAEHQVAHVVGAGQGPMPGTEAGVQQAADKPLFLAATDAAQLQVGTVGRLDHAAGAIPRRGRHGACLGGVQAAGVELDAADAAVQRLDDTQQAGTGRRTWYGQGRRGLVVVQKRYSNRRRGDRTAVPQGQTTASVHPARCWHSRLVSAAGLLARSPAFHPGEEPPLRAAFPVIQWRMARIQAAYSCGGSHG